MINNFVQFVVSANKLSFCEWTQMGFALCTNLFGVNRKSHLGF